METYTANLCGDGKHYHPGHAKADSKGCMNNSDMSETFVSLSASVRRPFSPGYYDPNYVQPVVDGVN
jgi:hypothetical protein